MDEALLMYLHGLFEIFRRRGRSQLSLLEAQLQVRKRRRKRRAAAFVSALIAAGVDIEELSAAAGVDADRACDGKRRTLWVRARRQDWWDRVVVCTFTDEQWLEHFRMKRRTFDSVCAKLRPTLRRRTTHLRAAIPLEKRVAVAVRYLASGSDFRTLSDLFGIGRTTVSKCVWEVCRAIRSVQRQFISLPRGDRLREVVAGFRGRWGFPQCGGALDCCHIPISPPATNADPYCNRDGGHSFILQAVVDHLSRFTNINVGWAGSAHDAKVLRNSTLFDLAESDNLFPPDTEEFGGRQVPILLLGDPAYPLLSWLMKGYPDNGYLTREQIHFNYRLRHAHLTVESAFGKLKGRWRCLLKRLDVSVLRAPTIVSSCCVLHNWCEAQGDEFLEDWWEEVDEPAELREPDVPAPRERTIEPQDVRRALARFFAYN